MIDVPDPENPINRYFGPAPSVGGPTVETPVGEPCLFCDEPIALGDQGMLMSCIDTGTPGGWRAVHRECLVRQVVGSVGHQRGLCGCSGGPGTMDDPPGMTKRQAALAAWAEYALRRGRLLS